MPPNRSNETVSVSAQSIEEVLAAIKDVADAIAANTAVISGTDSGSTTTRVASVDQARAILDYLVVSQLLARTGFDDRVVSAAREGNIIHLTAIPTTIDGVAVQITQALVTAPGAKSDLKPLEDEPANGPFDGGKKVTLDENKIPNDLDVIRIELQDADGVPRALGPRLGPDDGFIVDLGRRAPRGTRPRRTKGGT